MNRRLAWNVTLDKGAIYSLHPAESLIATSSGQRVFPMPRIDIDVSDEENCYEAMNSSNQLDNSLSLWKICGIAG